MKLIANVEKKTLRILENERSIFRGEYGADKLELYINKQLVNEYPTITALLSNGRKIGAYSTDNEYSIEEIDGEQYTKATFTLSKANGFTLSEGKMQITIWMNSINGNKQALGNVILNVINTTAFDDGDIIISGDVEGTLVNYRVELENLQGQVNTFNGRITNAERDIAYNLEHITRLENNKADKTDLTALEKRVTNVENNKANKADVATELAGLEHRVDVRFNQLIGEGASETLDTIGEISKALEEHNNEYDSLLAVVGNKVDKEIYEAHLNDYRSVVTSVNELGKYKANKTEIPTKLSQLERDIELGVNENKVLDIVKNNSQQVGGLKLATSEDYDTSSETELPTTKAVKKIVDTKVADLVNSAPETLDTLGELAEAIQENDSVVEALNSAIGNKANKDEVPTKLSELEIDVELGVSEDNVMEIVKNNSATAEELEIIETETFDIGTSASYDDTSDNEVPTTKAVKSMIESIINNALESDY